MQLTLNIPDNKLSFFMELVDSLGFVRLEHTEGLTSIQKELVDAEIRKAKENPEYMLNFDEAWKTLNLD